MAAELIPSPRRRKTWPWILSIGVIFSVTAYSQRLISPVTVLLFIFGVGAFITGVITWIRERKPNNNGVPPSTARRYLSTILTFIGAMLIIGIIIFGWFIFVFSNYS